MLERPDGRLTVDEYMTMIKWVMEQDGRELQRMIDAGDFPELEVIQSILLKRLGPGQKNAPYGGGLNASMARYSP